MTRRAAATAIVALLALSARPALSADPAPAAAPPAPALDAVIPRDALREDVRELVRTIESAHPDPYLRGGGKVAFHRRADELLRAIPPEGLTVAAFHGLVQPFLAAIRDGHTGLWPLDGRTNPVPGLPLEWRVIEQDLVVTGVYREQDRALLGARLAALEDVPLAELVARQARLRGADNAYHDLVHLAVTLGRAGQLPNLLPGWTPPRPLRVTLRPHTGGTRTVELPVGPAARGQLIEVPSRVPVPTTAKADQAFGFLDPERTTAYLRIDSMMGYREAFEVNVARGYDRVLFAAAPVWRKAHGTEPPQDTKALVAGLPAATDLLRTMVVEARAAGSRTLVVDLRRNGGGNSVISTFLLYFLYGRDAAIADDGGYQVRKYSPLWFKNYTGQTLDTLNRDRDLPLAADGYDFSEERAWRARHDGSARAATSAASPTAEQRAAWDELLALVPTFAAEARDGKHAAHWTPERVVVLGGAETYSAAFDLLATLYQRGATLVGTPSAQAGNCFIDILQFTLPNSGLAGSVSFKYSLLFPDDPARGEVLRPHHELTYAEYARYGFDPNADVLLAINPPAPPRTAPRPLRPGRG